MFKKKLLLFVNFVFLVGLFAYTGQASVNASKQEMALPPQPTGEITDPMLFEERWSSGNLPNERWGITNGTWITTTNGFIRQDDNTPEQINIAHEKVADIADGVIYGEMQLLTLPAGALFPHGFLFRYSDVNNFYGAGFIDEDTLALGRVTCLPTGGYRT